jgi:hypothetical protein
MGAKHLIDGLTIVCLPEYSLQEHWLADAPAPGFSLKSER